MTTLPIWFLVLPRIALIVAFFIDGSFPHLFTKWLSVPMALLIPRVLILIAIATVMGICTWFWIHLVVMMLVWGFNGLRIVLKRSDA